MSPATAYRRDARRAAVIGGALAAGATAAAAAVGVLLAPQARRFFGFEFPGIPDRFAQAAAIFAHNATLLAGVFAATLIVQSVWFGRPAAAGAPGGAHRGLVAVSDTLLAAAVTVNAVTIGAAVGAYGAPMIVALLPHAPLEVFAFGLGLSLYLDARGGRVGGRRAAALGAAGLATLAVAAAAETYLAI